MGQRSGGNCCECRHWMRDPSLEKPTHGLCLRQNIGDRANIATPVIETKALDICVSFLPRSDAQESAGPARGASASPALVIYAGDCA